MPPRRRTTRRHLAPRRPWEEWRDEEILDLRFSDLDVSLEGTWLEEMIERVLWELESRGLRIRPHFWLGDEWFSPERVPGVAIPFYLANPRLMLLERRQMLEVEGGTREECLKLLRHEVGHAVQHGYALQRRRRWQRHFGPTSAPYPDWYRPDPASKKYVHHLDDWYAQSHPVEDFAETFAVWLRSRTRWRTRYAGWPALAKLMYVDELMSELNGVRQEVRSRARPYEIGRLKKTLREHYTEKRKRYAVDSPTDWDRDLLKLFSPEPSHKHRPSAVSFLRKHRREIREQVARWTGEYQFALDLVLKEMIARCRELKLRVVGPERRAKLDFAILLTAHTMRTIYRGRRRQPL